MLTLKPVPSFTPFRAATGSVRCSKVAVPAIAPRINVSHNVSSVVGLQLAVAPQSTCKWSMMRHGNKVNRLGRPADQRKALIRGLVTEVIRHGKITTTKVKAMEIRKYVDRMITLAKRGDLHARRQALAFIYDKALVQNMFKAAPDRYKDREGGYCRVTPMLTLRRGDAAEMAEIELV